MVEPTDISQPQDRPVSFWQTKPLWCQPWTIVATGTGVSLASWLLLQRWWITTPVVAAVLLWWWLFLVLVPGSFAAAAASPEPGSAD
ncbi:hypothetical protein KQ313_03350 [Synechococcus sp. CS-1325]|uniref:DUF6737 family protein n=1 Tax=Synechococcus sp. CS-1325 TaxID=2847979 RepID=UPI000DB86B1D|nr:DUF6737 family protein [Synechococcus sp. CS-1325]MCT0198722.1 hypothetical protein [Synechococcus sp. CS-1325]PZV02081.1 MAG: hypothetical protein DCF24_02425 [Cyanobium sp.]